MTITDLGGACLEQAQRVTRRPLQGLAHGAPESPVIGARRVPGDVQLEAISLAWPRTTVAHLRGVRRHWEQHRTARPFSLTVPGDSATTTVIYAAPPRWTVRNAHWGELVVELVAVDSAEL
ncbi:MAG: hypothetical protein IT379_16855 [Deltaproteobacteria bacterium]|nr:hypothetical protein [Deltaproteobacteria bacterium]